ncbi:hypothetical protein B2J93_7909 [Marssonina coronariae]|uniref:Uncharacterized protein n=1 Tax=Diplocarpon coronariae TaxID=2795749 RepID=A0A218ZE61_9HELO|nr:hypothetical protein B2J93_7909 [Marssonina coronariae]
MREPKPTGWVFTGLFSLFFSRTATPSAQTDLSFMGSMGLRGWVAASGRGTVKGKASGVYADFYGNFVSPAIRAGTYTQIPCQGKLKVGTVNSVVVTAGVQTTANIAFTRATGSTTLFQIGEWDEKPTGFRNAEKQLRMHKTSSHHPRQSTSIFGRLPSNSHLSARLIAYHGLRTCYQFLEHSGVIRTKRMILLLNIILHRDSDFVDRRKADFAV